MKKAHLKPGILTLLLSLLLLLLNHSASKAGLFHPCFDIIHKDILKNTIKTAISPANKLAPPVITFNPITASQSRIAQLSWSTDMPLLHGTYFIERRPSASVGPWNLLTTLPYSSFRYDDIISFPYCVLTDFSYRVRFESLAGADNATSLIQYAILSDKTSPANVQSLNVSLLQTPRGFYPRITWDPITNDSIQGYIIQLVNNSGSPILTTVLADSGGYTHIAPDNCDKSYKYIIITKDRCNNDSAPDYDSAVQTIKLTVQPPAHCDKFINLSWNPNTYIPGGIGGYKIYRSDGSNIVEYDVPAKANAFSDIDNLTSNQTYLYSIKEYSKNGQYSSFSCQVVQPYKTTINPDVYIPQVTVEADSYIWVSYNLSPPNTVQKIILERSDNGTSGFRPVDSLQSSGTNYLPTSYYFSDTTADVHKQSYYYRLLAYDDCGGKTYSTNTSRSIFLQGTSQPTQNTLNWNSYETWTQDIESYKVYRILDGESSSIEMISNLPPSANTFTDLLTGVDPAKAICYWVVAKETSSYAISKSNTFCITKEPVLFMPNAFNPESTKNKLLRPAPVPLFIDPQSFKMIVFSRWGQQIFETTDMQNGWDGTINGQVAPSGLYSYFLKYKSPEGKEYTKRGTALLIR